MAWEGRMSEWWNFLLYFGVIFGIIFVALIITGICDYIIRRIKFKCLACEDIGVIQKWGMVWVEAWDYETGRDASGYMWQCVSTRQCDCQKKSGD
jgi:hypothetical protein